MASDSTQLFAKLSYPDSCRNPILCTDDDSHKVNSLYGLDFHTGKGTGLGLSLSYDIIKSLGGSIVLNCDLDDSTLIIINIPANKDTK